MRQLLLLPVLVSCTGDSATDSAASGPPVKVTIASPADGESFAWDDDVTFDVVVKQGKEEITFRSVVWSVGGDTLKGDDASAAAKSFGAGEVEVSVELYVGDEKFTADAVSFTVEEEPVDTDTGGDTGVEPGALRYQGTMATHVWYDGDFGSYDSDCPGSVTVDILDGTMSGSGQCLLDGQYDMYFVIEGTQNGGGISGSLIAESDGTEFRTPFTGTGKKGETLDAEYDKTFNDSGESVRIAGTWTADPI